MTNDQIIDETIDKAMILAYKRVLALPEMQGKLIIISQTPAEARQINIENQLRASIREAIEELISKQL